MKSITNVIGTSYIFTVKSITNVICAVWTSADFNLQMTREITHMIVDQSAAVSCLRRTAQDNPE